MHRISTEQGRPRSRSMLATVGGITITAGLAASLLTTAPAFAATDLSGTVLAQGAAASDVYVELYTYDSEYAEWYNVNGTYTDASGNWSLTGSLGDGDYALYYESEDSTALYSSDQGWDGSLDEDDMAKQFSVNGGNTSQSTFTQTLLSNAGAVTLHYIDGATNQPIMGDATGGYGYFYWNDGYTPDEGYIDSDAYADAYNADFAGTLTAGHVLPATYYDGYAYAYAYPSAPTVNYNSESLPPITITAGSTLDVTVTMYPSGTSYAYELLPGYDLEITGTAKVGSLLSTPQVSTSATLSYQWYSDAGPIPGATAPTFVPTTKQLGQALSVTVIARQTGYSSYDWYTDETKPVKAGDPSALTVSITGAPAFGSTLKANVTSSLGGTKEFQWYRNGTPIADADGSSYVPTAADIAQSLMVSVKSTVQGHSDAVSPSAAVVVAKDAADVTVTTKAKITTKTKTKVTVKVAPGDSEVSASGSVRVYYTATKFKTVAVASGSTKLVKLPKLKKGKTTIKVVYAGNDSYDATTVTKTVKVSKAKGDTKKKNKKN